MTGSVSFTEYRYYVTKFSILCALCAKEEDLFVAEKREILFQYSVRCAVHRERDFQRGCWGPPIHNMGLCGRPGEDPNDWKQFGPETTGQ